MKKDISDKGKLLTFYNEVKNLIVSVSTKYISCNDLTIIITGSMGRGEASIISHNNTFKILNDVDIYLVCDQVEQEHLHNISVEIKSNLEVDFADIGFISIKDLETLPCTMQNYDLKYGSRVVYGDKYILKSIPDYTLKMMNKKYFSQLFINRIAGILSCEIEEKNNQYRETQLIKFFISLGDNYLFREKGLYSPSYFERKLLFTNNYQGSQILGECIELSYSMKLDPMLNYSVHKLEEILKDRAQFMNIIKKEIFRYDISYILTNEWAGLYELINSNLKRLKLMQIPSIQSIVCQVGNKLVEDFSRVKVNSIEKRKKLMLLWERLCH